MQLDRPETTRLVNSQIKTHDIWSSSSSSVSAAATSVDGDRDEDVGDAEEGLVCRVSETTTLSAGCPLVHLLRRLSISSTKRRNIPSVCVASRRSPSSSGLRPAAMSASVSAVSGRAVGGGVLGLGSLRVTSSGGTELVFVVIISNSSISSGFDVRSLLNSPHHHDP